MFDEKAAASGSVPEPPVITGGLAEMPESVKKQWRETYAKSFAQAKLDSPNEPSAHAQRARRNANALLEVRKPTNYAEAMALPDWQVFNRAVKNGRLVLVTIEARGAEPGESKFFFDIPEEPAASESEKGKGAGGGKK